MNSQAEERVRRPGVWTNQRTPTKDIQLDHMQAKQWLEYLEGLSPCVEFADMLLEFQEQLEDALWLATWKREYVVMELELATVPGLIGALSSQEPSLLSDRSLDIQENVLAALSKLAGWT